MTVPQAIANAFIQIAEVNHYMIGFTHHASMNELQEAKQILITLDNAQHNLNPVLNLALDLIELAIKGLS